MTLLLSILSFTFFGGTFGYFVLGKWPRLLSPFGGSAAAKRVGAALWKPLLHFAWLFALPCLVLFGLGAYPFKASDLLVGSVAGLLACLAGDRLNHHRRTRAARTAGVREEGDA